MRKRWSSTLGTQLESNQLAWNEARAFLQAMADGHQNPKKLRLWAQLQDPSQRRKVATIPNLRSFAPKRVPRCALWTIQVWGSRLLAGYNGIPHQLELSDQLLRDTCKVLSRLECRRNGYDRRCHRGRFKSRSPRVLVLMAGTAGNVLTFAIPGATKPAVPHPELNRVWELCQWLIEQAAGPLDQALWPEGEDGPLCLEIIEPETWLTALEMAVELDVDVSTIRRRARAGTIKRIQQLDCYLYRLEVSP